MIFVPESLTARRILNQVHTKDETESVQKEAQQNDHTNTWLSTGIFHLCDHCLVQACSP